MRSTILGLIALLVLAPMTLACGDDATERGLAPANEEAVPTDPAKMRETEAQRQAELEDTEEALEDKGFDDAESGGGMEDEKSAYPED
jgi:hypothetical protein